MKPLRVLLYGGCHALIIRDYLKDHFADNFILTLLINFELIRSGQPFPYDDLALYDAVVFSPIEHREGYNTSDLVQACEAVGVLPVCFPWLEWHGYTPGGQKGLFKARHQWFYPELVERAAGTIGSFERFFEDVCATFPTAEALERTVLASTSRIVEAEQKHDMAVRISPFIGKHFRQSRLFLIPDHPSRDLYIEVIRQILDCLGLDNRVVADRLANFAVVEPQRRWRTPIFPRTADRLQLSFQDPTWIDDDVVPGGCMDLRTYLRLYYHPESVILRPTAGVATWARFAAADGLAESCPEPVADEARLLAHPIDHDCVWAGERQTYALIEALSGGEALARGDALPDRFSIDNQQWSSAWT